MHIKRKHSLEVPVWADISESIEGGQLAAFGVGYDASVWTLVQHDAPALDDEHGLGRFPKARLEQPTRYSAYSIAERETPPVRVLTLETRANLHFVQPLGGERVLAVGARCRRAPDGTADRNAAVYSRADSSKPVRELTLGDGIQHVQTTASGRIWVGYFDEGIFGNYGWGSVEGAEPMGASGLVCFGERGERRFEYDAAAAGTDSICDCYALNVPSDEEAWLSFYTDFPLVRLRRDAAPTVWPQELSAPQAFAVAPGWVLFAGGYKKDEPCTLASLENQPRRMQGRARLQFTRPDGNAWCAERYEARGPYLYGLQGTEIFRVDVREVAGLT